MKGIIDYLLSDEPTARILRDRFIFKVKEILHRFEIFQMKNPNQFSDHSNAQSRRRYQRMVKNLILISNKKNIR